MKKTISINLAGLVYQIDEDAYNLLENYLEKVKNTFDKPEEQEEIVNDIEYRFAELFSEKLGVRTEVVTLKMVQEAIETLGEVEEIDDENQEAASSSTNAKSNKTTTRKLFRSTDDKIIAGVLGGLGVYIGVDAIWLRLIFILLAIASVGVPIVLIYVVLWIVMPKAETASQKMQMQGEPVNLNNFQENIKKNFNQQNFQETGNRLADGLGEIIRLSAKTIALVLGAFTVLNVVVFSFVWFFFILYASVMEKEYINLLFNNSWDFLSLSTAIFFLVAIPSLMVVYFLYKAIKGHKIPWGKSFVIAAVLWFIALVIALIITLNNIKNFRAEANIENNIELPINYDTKHVKVEFSKKEIDGNLEFSLRNGSWESGGFSYNENEKILKLNTIFLKIEASKDSTFSLIANSEARGKTVSEAESYIDNFTYKVEVKNGNTLVIPTTLVLENETKFRAQNLTYTLNAPVGTKLSFEKGAHNFLMDITLRNKVKKNYLDDNTWLVTVHGLECLTCVDIDNEGNDLDAIIENKIEELMDTVSEKIVNEL